MLAGEPFVLPRVPDVPILLLMPDTPLGLDTCGVGAVVGVLEALGAAGAPVEVPIAGVLVMGGVARDLKAGLKARLVVLG